MNTTSKGLILGLCLLCAIAFAAFLGVYNREGHWTHHSRAQQDFAQQSSNKNKTKSHEDGRKTGSLADYMSRITDEENQFRPEGWGDKQWGYFVFAHRMGLADNGNVEFYGKIVDQDGEPLSNVEVMAVIHYHEPDIQSIIEKNNDRREKEVLLRTDLRGEFSVMNQIGSSLVLKSFSKDGYLIKGRKWYQFGFAPNGPSPPYNADRTKPMIFTMQRLN